MNLSPLLKRISAEFLGTGVFLTALVGSASSGSPLAHLALAVGLGIGILLAGTVGAGHLNPIVSLYFFAKGKLSLTEFFANLGAQLLGGVGGAWLGLNIWGKTLVGATGGGTYSAPAILGEVAATAGLVVIVGQLVKAKKTDWLAVVVPLWVFSAATWTATGAQANPAVSFALMFTGFSGANAVNQGAYILAQLGGLLSAVAVLTIMGDPASGKGAKKSKSKKN